MSALRNPGELLVFGNPPGHKRGCKCFACKHARARKNPGELLIFGNPAKKVAKGDSVVFHGYDGKDYNATVKKIVRSFAVLEYNVPGTGTVTANVHRKDWPRRINPTAHGRSNNPTHMQVSFDPGIKKYLAVIYDPKFGNLYASGFTKKQAAHALHERVREARRTGTHRNPELFDAIGPRDRVTFLNRFNQQQTGRVVMRSSHGGWVLNMGGPHGTPAVIDSRTPIVKVKKANPKTKQAEEAQDAAWQHQKKVQAILKKMPKPIRKVFDRNAKRSTPRRRRNDRQHVGDHQGVAMYFEGISYNAPALKLYGYSTDLALRRAIDRKLKKRRNPDETKAAVRLFEKFHGRDPKEITEKHVSAAHRKDYTALGDLEHLKVLTPLGQTAQFNFEDDGVKLASSADGKQLYCIGGNQNLSQCLDAASLEKDFIDMGEALEVQYLARKIHGNFEPISYFHKFGEKTGARPQLAYDKLKKQIFFVGGEYFIDTKQGVSPGIEN